ncbi:universal stress protein [Sphaerisporangium fuscum]|uniref:universal stress protein n=1 Tax=Sphaerisporangium fuscum TaxID=2835868 RepID=UPI001BDCC361|nr:universal stress protein [Sphaerisporangium fuscum]
MTGQIVVGVDGSPSAAAAVKWAADEAARWGARLRIVHVREPWSYEFPFKPTPRNRNSLSSYWEGALATATDWVRRQVPGVEVTSALITGAVAERLTTESESADELVLGSKGLGGLVGSVIGSVGCSVAGRAEGAVIVVKRPPETAFGEVVVGFDGSEVSEAALDYALQQAALRRARAHVLYASAAPPFAPDATAYAGAAQEALAEESREVWRRLEPWRERYPDVPMEASAVRGHPVTALCDASRHADLVVVGSGPQGVHGRPLLGSVGNGVLRHARCPVAIVRPRRARLEPVT